MFIKRRKAGVYLKKLLERKLEALVQKRLADPLPPPPPEPILASTPTANGKQMRNEIQDLAEYTTHIMKARTKAHMRLDEQQKYMESGSPPRGMACSLHINPYRPRDSGITQTLAELKKKYHAKILESLVHHYVRVVSTLEKDKKPQRNERKPSGQNTPAFRHGQNTTVQIRRARPNRPASRPASSIDLPGNAKTKV